MVIEHNPGHSNTVSFNVSVPLVGSLEFDHIDRSQFTNQSPEHNYGPLRRPEGAAPETALCNQTVFIRRFKGADRSKLSQYLNKVTVKYSGSEKRQGGALFEWPPEYNRPPPPESSSSPPSSSQASAIQESQVLSAGGYSEVLSTLAAVRIDPDHSETLVST